MSENENNVPVASSSTTSVLFPLPEGVEKNAEEIEEILRQQNKRKVSAFEAAKLEKDAKRNWDVFYKRNETRFFKDRHWTLREFQEILDWNKKDSKAIGVESQSADSAEDVMKLMEGCSINNDSDLKNSHHHDSCAEGPTLLEVGCGCGNFAIPLLDEIPNLKVYACDFSPRAVDFVKSHPNYDKTRIKAFVCDITEENCFNILHDQFKNLSGNDGDSKSCSTNSSKEESCYARSESETKFLQIDFLSMIFVLSAISPIKHFKAVENISKTLKSGGIVFFRDYGRYDMAQLRFKGGNKIDDNFYVRRDGTRAYYFTPQEVERLFTGQGQFRSLQCEFVHRRTVNVKENVDVGRIFVQGKFIKI